MTLALSGHDRALAEGELGPAAKMAMRILVRMAELTGASRMLDVTQAHVDSTIYVGDAGLEFAEKLAALGARVAIPTTLNVSGVDEHHWQEWGVPPDWAIKAKRQMAAYQSMGTLPTWTCAPYQTDMRPTFGQQIAWGESNAIAYANSVIGARTERYPDLLDICAAVTARVPAVGLHLTENRAGNVLIRLRGVPAHLQADDSFYPVLGYHVGSVAPDRVPVIEGLEVRPGDDQFKSLAAAVASSGAVALFHVVGHTPEARTRDEAFQGRSPEAIFDVGMTELRDARRDLTRTRGPGLDVVALGSPHFSLSEFQKLAALAAGRRRHSNVELVVATSRAVAELARRAGYLDAVFAFGGRVSVDTCILASPMLPERVSSLMTNSGKYAYYAPGLLGVGVAFGSLEDCVESAVRGQVVRDDSLWSGKAS